jgi:hypothetical protein
MTQGRATIEFAFLVSQHFDFLVTQHQFVRSIESAEHVRYVGTNIYFDVSTNPRDGLSVDFGRFGREGITPQQTEERISLQTLIGALETEVGTYNQRAYSPAQLLAYLSEGLRTHAVALIAASDQLYGKLRELRFWHVGHWTRTWGTTIVMSPTEISRNRELVPCIATLLSRP